MLIIRPTKTLAKKFGCHFPESGLAPSSLRHWLDEWYGNDFRIEKHQYVMLVNAETFFPVVMRAAPYSTLADRFVRVLPVIFEKLLAVDVAALQTEWQKVADPIRFAPTFDRSVVGVMVEFIKHLQEIHGYYRPYDLDNTDFMTAELADGLAGASRGYLRPIEEVAKRLGAEQRRPRAHLRLVSR